MHTMLRLTDWWNTRESHDLCADCCTVFLPGAKFVQI